MVIPEDKSEKSHHSEARVPNGCRPPLKSTPTTATLDFKDTDFNMTKAAERVRKTGSYESITKRYGWR